MIKVKTPTDNEIRQRDNAAQEEASRKKAMEELDNLMDLIVEIGKGVRDGGKVTLVDRWGDETVLVQYKPEPEAK